MEIQMELKNFLFRAENGIGILTVNRPEVRNALNTECQVELMRVVDYVDQAENIGALIITGSGEKAFSAGADIAGLRSRTMISAIEGIFPKAFRRLAECEKPVIAAVNGTASGGGCELALACDIRIASENAKFSLPELGIGVMPGGGGTQRLAKVVGIGRAKEIILTGRSVDANEALSIGLVTRVVSKENLMAEAVATAEKIMLKGPLAVRLVKKAIDSALSTDSVSGAMIEQLSFSVLTASEDRMEGLNAFLEKRQPKFNGK